MKIPLKNFGSSPASPCGTESRKRAEGSNQGLTATINSFNVPESYKTQERSFHKYVSVPQDPQNWQHLRIWTAYAWAATGPRKSPIRRKTWRSSPYRLHTSGSNEVGTANTQQHCDSNSKATLITSKLKVTVSSRHPINTKKLEAEGLSNN